jgi:hypothetical protein
VQDGVMADDLNDDNVAGVNQASASQVRHRREIRVHRNFPELNVGSESDISEYETEEEEDALMGDVTTDGVRHVFRDETWSQSSFTYDPKPRDFIGRRGTSQFFFQLPTMLQLFELFWPFTTLRRIVEETNRYATMVLDAFGNTRGGRTLKNLTVPGLKAFLAIHMYMGMKRQLNYKSYWEKEGSLFHCPIISNIMNRAHFAQLRRCLHITNPASYEHIQLGDIGYDKLRQVRWLVDAIRDACSKEWSLGKFVTIDEMMVWYKGSYCPIRQYMPKKPEKWGIKFCVLVDLVLKFIFTFEIYCGKNMEADVTVEIPRGEAGAAYGVVIKLLRGLEEKGHCVVMDNYFCSIPLFQELVRKGIYATGTVRSNRIGLPQHLKNTKSWKRCEQGHIE